MITKIISFSGGMAAGKDTFGAVYKELCEKENIKVKHLSFANALKNEVDELIRRVRNNESVAEISHSMGVSCIHINKLKNVILEEDYIHPNFTARDRTPATRFLLQYWGTEVRRSQNDNYWVDIVKEQIKENLKNNVNTYSTDARFINELKMLTSIGATTVLLDAPLEVRLKRLYDRDHITVTEEQLKHPSETQCIEYKDYTFVIDTTKQTPADLEKMLGE